MFFQPTLKYENLFSFVEDNKIQITDQTGYIFKFYLCDYPLKEGYNDPVYASDDQYSIWSCTEYSSVIAAGRTFLQKFEEIVELRGNKMKRICVIPNISKEDHNDYMLKLLCYNDKLHFIDGKNMYVLDANDWPKPVMEFGGENVICFCDHTIVWIRERCEVLRLAENYQTELICKMEEDVKIFCFGQGGVAIFSDADDKINYFIDLVNFTFKKVCYEKKSPYTQEGISNIVEIEPCGLSLHEDDLLAMFGDEFKQQRDNLFDEFRNRQLLMAQFPHGELNQVVRDALGSCKIDQLEWDTQLNRRMNHIQTQVEQQAEQMSFIRIQLKVVQDSLLQQEQDVETQQQEDKVPILCPMNASLTIQGRSKTMTSSKINQLEKEFENMKHESEASRNAIRILQQENSVLIKMNTELHKMILDLQAKQQ